MLFNKEKATALIEKVYNLPLENCRVCFGNSGETAGWAGPVLAAAVGKGNVAALFALTEGVPVECKPRNMNSVAWELVNGDGTETSFEDSYEYRPKPREVTPCQKEIEDVKRTQKNIGDRIDVLSNNILELKREVSRINKVTTTKQVTKKR